MLFKLQTEDILALELDRVMVLGTRRECSELHPMSITGPLGIGTRSSFDMVKYYFGESTTLPTHHFTLLALRNPGLKRQVLKNGRRLGYPNGPQVCAITVGPLLINTLAAY